MAINPLLLNVKPISEITTVNNPTKGHLLFYDGSDELKKVDIVEFQSLIGGIAKPLAITDASPTVSGWYKPTTSGTYANAGGLVAQVGYDTLFYFDGTTWSKVEVALPVNDNVINSVETSKGSTGNAVFEYVKKEIETKNLFNKNIFLDGFAFNTANGEVVPMNASNGISDLIPTKPNTLYGLAQIGANDSSITALIIVEYDINKTYLGWSNAQSRATLKTGANTHYVRINPNSASGTFEFWKNNFIFSEIENFPIDYAVYGNVEKQIFQNDLSFFEKHNFLDVITLTNQGVTFQNETLKITTGEKDFYNKQIFSLGTALKYSGEAVIVTRLKGNYNEFLPYFLDQDLIYSTINNAVSNFKVFYGSNTDEFFIVTKGNWDKNYFFVFGKNMRLGGDIQSEINLKIEQFILYLDSNGKPRNLGNVTEAQLQTLSNQIQALSNSVPTTIDQRIASQVPAIVQQQIGSDIDNYLSSHINDFTFLQPNYIQANSTFNLAGLNSAMNGKFISIIQDIDLQGATIDFVAQNVKGLKLVFNGGRILNGKIRSNYTKCIFNSNEAFVNVEILNQFQNDFAIPEWFGAKIDGQDGGIGNFTKDDSFAFNQALKFTSLVKLTGNRTMIVKKPIILNTGNTIEADKNFTVKLGDASNCTMIKNKHIDIPHDAINPVVYPLGFVRDKNITIRGGIWDGNGLKQNRADNPAVGDMPDVIGTPRFLDGDTLNYVGFMMKFADIDGLVIEDLIFKNARTYFLAAGGLKDYAFRNINMIREYHIENGDGIHLHGHCYNGVVENISGQSGDDLFAVTTSEGSRGSIRVGDVKGLRIRNLYNYGEPEGATPQNPKSITDGIIPDTRTTRCVRLTYTDNVIDDVVVSNVRGYNGKFLCEVLMAYLHLPDFSGQNGKIGSVVVENVKNNDGCSPISVGANTKIDHITLKNFYIEWKSTNEYTALVKMTDNFGGGDQWELTRINTIVIDNGHFIKGNTLYDAPHGLVWMTGIIKNLFINNLVIETLPNSTPIDSLFSGRIKYISLTNSKLDVQRIFSTNGYASTDLVFRESGNEWVQNTNVGVMPNRILTETLPLSSNPTNPKIGDKILKSDGIYLFTNAWNKL